jgi:transcriptional regulator of arginine metabolism
LNPSPKKNIKESPKDSIRDERHRLKCVATELLLSGKIQSQEELREKLFAKGFNLNQSKISRLIHRLGALKIPNTIGQLTYTLPEIAPPPGVTSQVSDLVVAIKKNEAMIVVYTNYGAANLVARLLEYHDFNREILGTIAGSDTIFVAPKSVQSIEITYQEVKKILQWQEA